MVTTAVDGACRNGVTGKDGPAAQGGSNSQQEPPPRPFRWSLSARVDGGPDRLGVPVEGAEPVRRWYLDELWQQSEPSWRWVGTLPAGHGVNVSMPYEVWSWLGNGGQPRIGSTFPPARWFDESVVGAPRHERLPEALAHARALVEAGRGRVLRDRLVRVVADEPGFAVRGVRALASELRHRAS